MIYDITDMKRTEEKLQILTRTLEAKVEERTRERDRIWNRSLDLIAVLTRDGAPRSVNPAWTRCWDMRKTHCSPGRWRSSSMPTIRRRC